MDLNNDLEQIKGNFKGKLPDFKGKKIVILVLAYLVFSLIRAILCDIYSIYLYFI